MVFTWWGFISIQKRKRAPLIDNQLLPYAICFCDLDQQIDATLTTRLHVVYINCDRFICAQTLNEAGTVCHSSYINHAIKDVDTLADTIADCCRDVL